MAQQVGVLLVDDIDGGEAAETVSFGLDGSVFEIDLSDANAARLREVFAPFVGAARRVGTAGRPAVRAVRPVGGSVSGEVVSRDETRAIRAWARDRGLTVSDRGRIPAEVLEVYRNREARTPQPVAPAPQEQAPAPQEQAPAAPGVAPLVWSAPQERTQEKGQEKTRPAAIPFPLFSGRQGQV